MFRISSLSAHHSLAENREKRIKSFVSSRKSLHLVLMLTVFETLRHYNDLNDRRYECNSPFTILWKKNILRGYLLSARDSM